MSPAPISYGLNLQAFAVYLLVFQHVPVHRCAQLIADLTGARPSDGFIHGMLTRAAKAVDEAVKTIKALILLAAVVGFDETTLRVGPAGQKRYVLCAVTGYLTLFHLGGRDLETFIEFGILTQFHGIAVHDRYAVYDNKTFKTLAGHQLCTAHLLRDLKAAAELDPSQQWPAQADNALRKLIKAWHKACDAGQTEIPATIRDPLIDLLHQAVLVGLSDNPRNPGGATAGQSDARNLLECLRDRQADVTRFCHDTRVFPTNNISEQAVRPEKTQQKISGRLRSEKVTKARLSLRSFIATARKNNINVMTALRDALAGHAWTPTAHAPT
jgi:hypothetical protein